MGGESIWGHWIGARHGWLLIYAQLIARLTNRQGNGSCQHKMRHDYLHGQWGICEGVCFLEKVGSRTHELTEL